MIVAVINCTIESYIPVIPKTFPDHGKWDTASLQRDHLFSRGPCFTSMLVDDLVGTVGSAWDPSRL